jgi:hypothetical protein
MFKTADWNAAQPERQFQQRTALAVRHLGPGLKAQLVKDAHDPSARRGSDGVPPKKVHFLSNHRSRNVESLKHVR